MLACKEQLHMWVTHKPYQIPKYLIYLTKCQWQSLMCALCLVAGNPTLAILISKSIFPNLMYSTFIINYSPF